MRGGVASRRTRAATSQARHINLEDSKPNKPMASSYAAIGAVLPLFLLAVDAALAPSGPPAAAPTRLLSLEDACKQTAELHDLCMATLSPDRSSLTADAAGLTRAAILAVQKNASETATYLSSIDEDDNVNKTAQLQQCLEDCGER